ncbi:MAG: alpha/beta hydrolase fold domain-containing protein [Christensenellales bacterium]
MTSLLTCLTRLCIKAYTYKYRKNHISLSKNVKLKNNRYTPKNFSLEVLRVDDIYSIEKLSYKNSTSNINIIVFHGGGPCQPMGNLYHKVAEKLAKLNDAIVYSIDYVPNADYVYPALHDICYDACVRLEKIIDFGNTIMIGDSYGANLMMSTCHKLQSNGYKTPRKLICISPYVDLALTGDSYEFNCYKDPTYSLPKNQSYEKYGHFLRKKSSYVGSTSPFEPYLSPVYLEYKDFPPVLIQVGSYETDLSDSIMLKSALEKHDNNVTLSIYDGLFHDFQYFAPFLRESKVAWEEIVNFVKE